MANQTQVAVRWEEPDFATDGGMRGCAGRDVKPAEGTEQLVVGLAVRPMTGGGLRAVVAARGEIDIASVEGLHDAVLAVVRAAAPGPDQPLVLVLDLSKVTLLEPTGLRLLEHLHADGMERGWTVQVIAPAAPTPNRVLRIALSRGWLPRGLVQRQGRPLSPRADLLSDLVFGPRNGWSKAG